MSLQKTVPSFQSTQTRVTLGNRLLWQNLFDDSIVRQAFDDSIHVCFDRWLRICPASKSCVPQFAGNGKSLRATSGEGPSLMTQYCQKRQFKGFKINDNLSVAFWHCHGAKQAMYLFESRNERNTRRHRPYNLTTVHRRDIIETFAQARV